MDKKKTTVRLGIVGPFLLYLLVFLLWFPQWQHAPNSAPAHFLGLLFASMTLALVVVCTIGNFFLPAWRGGWDPVGKLALRLIEATFAGRDHHRRGAFMPLFRADSVTLSYTDVEAAKQWWCNAFDCKQVKVPAEWDNPLPSDVALQLPGYAEPTILLSQREEMARAGLNQSPPTVPVIFSGKLQKALEQLLTRGVAAGPIQGDGETEFFEVRDLEGSVIEICREP